MYRVCAVCAACVPCVRVARARAKEDAVLVRLDTVELEGDPEGGYKSVEL